MFKFTAGFVRTWKPTNGKLKDFYQPRMQVRVHPKGNVTVTMAVKRQGVSWRKMIGKYPDNRLDKQQIDQLNARYRKWYLFLEDQSSLPQDIIDRASRTEERLNEQAADDALDAYQAGGPMDQIIDRYLSDHVSSLKTADQIERMYAPREEDWTSGTSPFKEGTGGCLGAIREIFVAQFDRSFIVELLRQIEASTMRNRARSQVMRLGRWMVEQDIIASNPANNLERKSENLRHRTLTESEIKNIWPLLSAPLRFALCTGQRRSEIADMKWGDIEGDTWTQEDTKNGIPHKLKLPAFALAQLPKTPDGDFVWVTDRGPKIADSTLTHTWKRASDQLGLETRLHDARRTAGTGIAELMGSAEAADRVLNHKLPGVSGRYVKTDFGQVKAESLERWNRHLEEVVNG